MEKKYTPGPWRVFENMALDDLLVESDMGRWHYSNRHIAAGKDTIIAEVSTSVGNAPGYPHAAKEEFMANVTLIAAAPELVEALECTAAKRAYDAGMGASEWEAFLLDHERAALKKAGVL